MSLTFHNGSGSPFAWRVWLALEHKRLAYDLRTISFDRGDHKTPEFLRQNPRGKVPLLVDGDFVLYESNAIVEYLDEAYPGRGAPLFPGDVRRRALVRRLVSEAADYFDKALDGIVDYAFAKDPAQRDEKAFAAGKAAVAENCALFAAAMQGDFLAGPLSAADFALYPLVAFLDRCRVKLPDFDAAALLAAALAAWKARVEALPYLPATIPPHWQKKD